VTGQRKRVRGVSRDYDFDWSGTSFHLKKNQSQRQRRGKKGMGVLIKEKEAFKGEEVRPIRRQREEKIS